MKQQPIYLNERVLKFKEVHVIGDDKKSLGVMSSRNALNIAKDAGLDLFLVTANSNPPTAKILDYGQMKYEQDKKERGKPKNKQDTKEIKISSRIQQHDLDVFTKRAIKFLEHSDKVKITCVFKAREIEHTDLGLEKIQVMLNALADYCVYEGQPILSNKTLSITVNPKKQ